MGKTIVSWSPVHGQGATTSNLAALASIFSLDYEAKNLITHTQLSYSTLESLYGKEMAQEVVGVSGMLALERLAKSNLLKKDAVMDYTEAVFAGRLDILGGTETTNNSQELIEILLEYIKDAYDLVWIDAHSGKSNPLTNRLIENADVVLVNLPQNRYILDSFFKNHDYPEVLDQKDFLILISSYEETSLFSTKKIARTYKTKMDIYPILYSNLFKDAANKRELAEFFYRNHDVQKGNPIFPFINCIKQINKVIAKRTGIGKLREEDED